MQIKISWLLQKPTDLDLHCFQKQNLSRFSRTRVKGSALSGNQTWYLVILSQECCSATQVHHAVLYINLTCMGRNEELCHNSSITPRSPHVYCRKLKWNSTKSLHCKEFKTSFFCWHFQKGIKAGADVRIIFMQIFKSIDNCLWHALCHIKICLWAYEDSKGSDQPARTCSLIRAFLDQWRMYQMELNTQIKLCSAKHEK